MPSRRRRPDGGPPWRSARPYLIAEIGVNHDGDPARAAAMVERSAAAGFDAVKFQHWYVDELLAATAPNATYQGAGDQHDLLEKLALSPAELAALRDVARAADVDFIVTPDGRRALRDVVALGPDALKIGSGDADNPQLLGDAVATALPLLVSTGMLEERELAELAARLAPAAAAVVLHCVSAYPTPLSEARLGRLATLQARFGEAGFSDHTEGSAAAIAATALGAVVIEKHVTHDPAAPGPDHSCSLDLDGAAAWVCDVREVATALLEDRRSSAETENRLVVRKSLHARRPLPAGHRLGADDLELLRPLADGIPAGELERSVGRRLRRAVDAGERLATDDLEP